MQILILFLFISQFAYGNACRDEEKTKEVLFQLTKAQHCAESASIAFCSEFYSDDEPGVQIAAAASVSLASASLAMIHSCTIGDTDCIRDVKRLMESKLRGARSILQNSFDKDMAGIVSSDSFKSLPKEAQTRIRTALGPHSSYQNFIDVMKEYGGKMGKPLHDKIARTRILFDDIRSIDTQRSRLRQLQNSGDMLEEMKKLTDLFESWDRPQMPVALQRVGQTFKENFQFGREGIRGQIASNRVEAERRRRELFPARQRADAVRGRSSILADRFGRAASAGLRRIPVLGVGLAVIGTSNADTGSLSKDLSTRAIDLAGAMTGYSDIKSIVAPCAQDSEYATYADSNCRILQDDAISGKMRKFFDLPIEDQVAFLKANDEECEQIMKLANRLIGRRNFKLECKEEGRFKLVKKSKVEESPKSLFGLESFEVDYGEDGSYQTVDFEIGGRAFRYNPESGEYRAIRTSWLNRQRGKRSQQELRDIMAMKPEAIADLPAEAFLSEPPRNFPSGENFSNVPPYMIATLQEAQDCCNGSYDSCSSTCNDYGACNAESTNPQTGSERGRR